MTMTTTRKRAGRVSGLCRMNTGHEHCWGDCDCPCHDTQPRVRLFGPDAATRRSMRAACQQSTKGATR